MRNRAKGSRVWVLGLLLAGLLIVPSWVKAVEVNRPAPDFTLPSTTGKAITLNQFRGKKMVLIQFYGIAFGAT